MCCYVDDILVHGGTRKQGLFRQKLLTLALKHLQKRVSTKLDRTVKQEGLLVGMKFVPDGIVIDDHTVEALKLAMAEPVKTLKQARRVLGIINYAQESFRWDSDNQTWYADRLAGLHEAISAPKFHWSTANKEVVQDMLSRIDTAERVPCRPDELLDNGWVIVVKTDASATGIGASLLLVLCADARDMTEEKMSDAANVRLIATYSKVLSTSEQKWLTFETEAYGMVKALKRWGKFLMQVTIDQGDRWAVSLYMDSSTALSKWMNVDVPGSIDFCNAKELRFRAWAEQVGYVKYMNFCMKFIPGLCNDWADLLSRVAEKLATVAEEQMRAFGEKPPALLMPDVVPWGQGETRARERA
jgi:hypothetical protein